MFRAMHTIGGKAFWHRCRRDDSGAELIEFAFASLLFFTLIFGIMDFSRMIFDYNIVSTTARDAARYASVRGSGSGHACSTSDVQNFAANESVGVLTTANVSVSWPSGNAAGGTVQVTTTYRFTPIVGLLPQGAVTLTSTTKMIITR